MTDSVLKKFGLILAVSDGALAFALMAGQSIVEHRVSAMQIVVSDFFWMAVLSACLLKFKVPKRIVFLACVFIFLSVVSGVIQIISFIQDQKPLVALFTAFYVLGIATNLVFYLTWMRNRVAIQKAEPHDEIGTV